MSLLSSRQCGPRLRQQRGIGLVETVVALPVLLLATLGLIQMALFFHAKSNVDYATFEAARAGSTRNADAGAMAMAFRRAMIPYYGGGTTQTEILGTMSDMLLRDFAVMAVRIEILSPTPGSFDDYNSPALQAALDTSDRVIPNVGLSQLTCPRDMPGCNSDPASNRSGQSLQDANLLKIRVTYGIPEFKQVPMVARLYIWGLGMAGVARGDAFQVALVASGRIPVVSQALIRMQSDAIENSSME